MNIASLFKKKNNVDDNQKPEMATPTQVNNTPNANEPVVSTPTAEVEPMPTSAVKPANWIEISEDGEFICSECGNKSEPETNTENGTVTANLQTVKSDLAQYPTKIIYGICPVCGMEFTFKHSEGKLFLEPSEMMK